MSSLYTFAILTFLFSGSCSHLLGDIEKGEKLFAYRQNIYAARKLLQNLCPEIERLNHGVIDDSLVPFHTEFAKMAESKMLESLTECLNNQKNFHDMIEQPVTEQSMVNSLSTAGEATEALLNTTQVTETQPTSEQTTTIDLPAPEDCHELYERGNRCPGVYVIKPPYAEDDSFPVWCDFIDGHGWTVIQKRFNGSVDFNKNWTDYQTGFGDIHGEYWLGLDKIRALTRLNNKLYIVLKAANGTTEFGLWSNFYINGLADGYKLMINNDGYRGSLDSSSLSHHHGMKFSTPDNDQDSHSSNCAQGYQGAWWFKGCYLCHLNGVHNGTGYNGIVWRQGSSYDHFTESVMRVSGN